ncbi:MAG: hypothetical protein PVF87_10885, partial [Acidimicrobiia bacterium]
LEGISTSEAMRSAMASEMLGDEVADPLEDPESTGAMFDMMNDCFTNEELGRILGAGFQP